MFKLNEKSVPAVFSDLNELDSILSRLKSRNIFLVSGKNSLLSVQENTSWQELQNRYQFCVFQDFSPNPKEEDILKGIEFFCKHEKEGDEIDTVLALGGGSSLDVAKSIYFFALSGISIRDFIRDDFDSKEGIERWKRRRRSFIAIPTTSGSGSEATHFAVLYVDGKKYSIADPLMLPDSVILDSHLLTSLPKEQRAATGMDAFCQGIESFWSTKSTEESLGYSIESIKCSLRSLESFVNFPNVSNQHDMMYASHLAGKAINITKTTASHAMSYALTSHFQLPHGAAVGMSIDEVMDLNYRVSESNVNDKRGREFVRAKIEQLFKLLNCSELEEAKQFFKTLKKKIGLPNTFKELGCDDPYFVADLVDTLRLGNNPRKLTKEDFLSLLEKIKE